MYLLTEMPFAHENTSSANELWHSVNNLLVSDLVGYSVGKGQAGVFVDVAAAMWLAKA